MTLFGVWTRNLMASTALAASTNPSAVGTFHTIPRVARTTGSRFRVVISEHPSAHTGPGVTESRGTNKEGGEDRLAVHVSHGCDTPFIKLSLSRCTWL